MDSIFAILMGLSFLDLIPIPHYFLLWYHISVWLGTLAAFFMFNNTLENINKLNFYRFALVIFIIASASSISIIRSYYIVEIKFEVIESKNNVLNSIHNSKAKEAIILPPSFLLNKDDSDFLPGGEKYQTSSPATIQRIVNNNIEKTIPILVWYSVSLFFFTFSFIYLKISIIIPIIKKLILFFNNKTK